MRNRLCRLFVRTLVMMALILSGALPAIASPGKAPSRYIVVMEPGVNPDAVARGHGVAISHLYTHALNGFAAPLSPSQLRALAVDPWVAYVEPDRAVHAWDQTLPTGVDRIEADQNDAANIDGVDERVDVDIAVIDTGIDLDHPDLNVHQGVDCTKGPDCRRGGDGDDGHGHGTHVAGTAAAIDNSQGVVGIAPGARVWAVKVLRDDGSGFFSDVIEGIDYVTAQADQIEVANMSLGGQGQMDSLRTAIQNSVGAGVVYAVAAGNDSEDIYGPDGTFDTDDDFIPAAYPEVMTISALSDTDGQPGGDGPLSSWGGEDRNNDGVDDGKDDSFAFFSNFSASVVDGNPVTSSGAAIDLLLPGVDIYSTYKDGGYATMSGTSMSSPHGAGLTALHVAVNGRDLDGDGDHDADDVYAIRQALIDGGVAQDSSDGLVTLNDPDENWEHIGWASSAVGDPPTVSWVNPKDGDTVSGTVTIQIGASDTEDDTGTLTVEWRVDGGTWLTATYNSDTGYYEDSWDSTGVSDGEHILDAQATDSDGNTASDSVTVTTENTDDPPTASWVNPKDGDTVKDTVAIQIDASDDRDSGTDLSVEWQVDDGTWQTATYSSTSGYYEDTWDSTGVSDGDHNLDARATDTGGNVSSEARITVSVSNEAGGMYIWDIGWRETGPHLKATVTIHVDSDNDGLAESSDDPVGDATVDLTLSLDSDGDGSYDDGSQSYTGTTDSKGQVEFQWKFAPSGKYEAKVTDVTHSSYTWNSSLGADNLDYYTVK